jgi:hypothetical protein
MPETLEFAPTLLAEAELCAHGGDYERALALAQQSLGRARPLEQITEAHVALNQMHISHGDPAEAAAHAIAGLAHATRLDSPRIMSLAHLAMARGRSCRGDPDADASFDAALSWADAAGCPYERTAVLEARTQHLERRSPRPSTP